MTFTDCRDIGQSKSSDVLRRRLNVLLATRRGQQTTMEPTEREWQPGMSSSSHRLDEPEQFAGEHNTPIE